MAAVTICSDFGAPKNKVWHCIFIFYFIYILLYSYKYYINMDQASWLVIYKRHIYSLKYDC